MFIFFTEVYPDSDYHTLALFCDIISTFTYLWSAIAFYNILISIHRKEYDWISH